MKYTQGSILETLRRVQGFLDTNNTVLAAVNQSGARTQLDDAVKAITTNVVNQRAGIVNAIGETAKQRKLRLTLRIHYMRPIARVAKRMLGVQPELSMLRMPPEDLGPTDLVGCARGMADAAEPHSTTLIAGGLKPGFVAQLLDAAKAVEDSLVDRSKSRGRRAGATGGLTKHEKAGREELKVLDALIVPEISGNAELLSEWRSIKKIGRKPGRPVSGTSGTGGGSTQAA